MCYDDVTKKGNGWDRRDSGNGRRASTISVLRSAPGGLASAAVDPGLLHARLLGAHASLLVFGALEGSLGPDGDHRDPDRRVEQGQRLDRRDLRRAGQLDRLLPRPAQPDAARLAARQRRAPGVPGGVQGRRLHRHPQPFLQHAAPQVARLAQCALQRRAARRQPHALSPAARGAGGRRTAAGSARQRRPAGAGIDQGHDRRRHRPRDGRDGGGGLAVLRRPEAPADLDRGRRAGVPRQLWQRGAGVHGGGAVRAGQHADRAQARRRAGAADDRHAASGRHLPCRAHHAAAAQLPRLGRRRRGRAEGDARAALSPHRPHLDAAQPGQLDLHVVRADLRLSWRHG